jgi:signal transduction histidine kinase
LTGGFAPPFLFCLQKKMPVAAPFVIRFCAAARLPAAGFLFAAALAPASEALAGLCWTLALAVLFLPPHPQTGSAWGGRIAGLMLVAAAALASPWGRALALCLAAGLLFSEALLITGAMAAAVQRLLLLALAAIALFFGVLPEIVAAPGADLAMLYARNVALALAIAVAIAAMAQPAHRAQIGGDFFFALLFALLLAVFALAATALTALGGVSYYRALGLALSGALALAAAAALLWLPVGGGGLAVIFARHVVSLSVPLEQWTARLAELARERASADEVLAGAMADLASLPPAAGIRWQAADAAPREIGDTSGLFRAQVRYAPLSAEIFCRRPVAPAQRLNFYLLVRIAAEYYLSKRREEQYARENFSRAVYETGARLTHDIKNAVHALSGLADLAKEDSPKAAGIIRRQLPELARRLAAATQKLKAPQIQAASARQNALSWWRRAQSRWEGKPVQFKTALAPPASEAQTADGATVPAALFDRALDNLLENALAKPGPPPVYAALSFDDKQRPALRITDGGAAIPPARAARILTTPVDSESGLGIALYHLAQEAAQNNCRMTLEQNRDGKVVFALAPAADD